MALATVPNTQPDPAALLGELRRRMLWVMLAILVGAAVGCIAALYSNASSLVPQAMVSLARFFSGGIMPASHERLFGAALSGALIGGTPVYLAHAWRFVVPALRRV